MLFGIRLPPVLLQEIQEYIFVPFPLKALRGDLGRIFFCPQLVDLLQPVGYIIFAGDHLYRKQFHRRRAGYLALLQWLGFPLSLLQLACLFRLCRPYRCTQ